MPGDTDPLITLFTEIVAVEVELWEGLDGRLRQADALTVGTFNLLRVIGDTPACRVQDLARALALTVGGTSKAVDRAERSGLCRRVRHPTDRRSSIIELTDDGRGQLARARTIVSDELERRIGGALSARRISALAADVAAIRAAGEPRPLPAHQRSR